MREPIRIGNCSGFFGDRFSAAREMVQGGHLDVLTGDYLAELTMFILWRTRDRSGGYARTFLRQAEQILGTCHDRKIRLVTNAGGLNPAGLAVALRELADHLGVPTRVAHVEGDDLLPRLPDLQRQGHPLTNLDTGTPLAHAGSIPVTANAYLGGWGIAAALDTGADVVVCPRVTDASLVVGPAAWWHGWARDDWDALAGAVTAGHVIECGTQATGGNYSGFTEIADLLRPGFPLAEVAADGSSVITKHPGTGGAVTVGTVTAQLVYEIAGPAYLNPDVTTYFDTVRLAEVGSDRVRVFGTKGSPPPPTTKVCANLHGGYRVNATLVLTGLDLDAKSDLVEGGLRANLGPDVELDLTTFPLTDGTRHLSVTARADDAALGRRFFDVVTALALSSYPGFHFLTLPPAHASSYGIHWPTLVPTELVHHAVVTDNGERIAITPTPPGAGERRPPSDVASSEPTVPTEAAACTLLPLGRVADARSGDKGGNANIGLWVRSARQYQWLEDFLTPARLRDLLPEAKGLAIDCHPLPNLLAVNVVLHGLLGDGVGSSIRPDPQAKALGEYLRSRLVPIPTALVTSLEEAGPQRLRASCH